MEALRAKFSEAREKAEGPDLTFAPNLIKGAAATPAAVPGSVSLAWPGSAGPHSFQTTGQINLATEKRPGTGTPASSHGSPHDYD